MATRRSHSPADNSTARVGAALARLRRHSGLTGSQLGKLTGMSQAKISKIETGAVNPAPEDVQRIASALGVGPAEIEKLTQQAEHERDTVMDWRFGRNDPATWQREIAELEADARELRVFQPAVLSGLLQTSDYARSALVAMHDAWAEPSGRQTPLAEAVSARMHRQEILEDPAKSFHFVIPETVLHNLLGRPEEMPVQLRRLHDVAQMENVTLKIIPQDAQWPFPPLHGFSLIDDSGVIIDLFNTVVVTVGQSDLRLYREVFDAMESRATSEIRPILDRYRRLYLKVAAEQ
jgi:transcriptional regulator with XRE-family HTH domain